MPTGGGKYSMFCYSRVLSKGVTAVVISDTINGIDRGSGAKGLRGCRLNVCYINSKMKDYCLSGKECPYQFFHCPRTTVLSTDEGTHFEDEWKEHLGKDCCEWSPLCWHLGIDFLPRYSKLHIFKECEIQIVAFTGTFTGTAEKTVPTIIERLKLVNPRSSKCHWTGQMKSNVQK